MSANVKNHYRNLSCVIIGSYRKSLSQLFQLREVLESLEINVMSPVGSCSINPGEEFVILNEDPIKDPKLLQDSIFGKIRSASFVVVGNFDHYLGATCIFEMGYSIAQGVPLLTVEQVTDPNLAPYCRLLSEVFPQVDLLTETFKK
jgi:hypothetical protein